MRFSVFHILLSYCIYIWIICISTYQINLKLVLWFLSIEQYLVTVKLLFQWRIKSWQVRNILLVKNHEKPYLCGFLICGQLKGEIDFEWLCDSETGNDWLEFSAFFVCVCVSLVSVMERFLVPDTTAHMEACWEMGTERSTIFVQCSDI